MLSLRYRAGAKTALNRPIAALSRSVYQFAKSGHNPRTTVLLTDLKDDVTLKALKESVKDIKEIIGVELQPGCALHYIKQEDAAKTIDILTKMKYSARLENVSLPALKVASVSNEITDILQTLKPISQSIHKNGEELLVFRAPFRLDSEPVVDLSWIKDAELKKTVSVQSSAVEAKPAVILRHVSHLSQSQVKDILRNFNPQYINFHQSSRDLSDAVENVIAVFPSEQAALNCLATIHNSTVNGIQLKANFTHWKEYIVQLRDLPQQVAQEDVLSTLGRLSVLETSFQRSADHTSTTATIVFALEKDAELAELLLARAPFLKSGPNAKSKAEVVRFEAGDIVVKFSAANPADFKKLQAEMMTVFGNKCETMMALQKNESSVIAFTTLAEATIAKDLLLSKHAELALSSAPVLTAHPAFAVELDHVNSAKPHLHLKEDQSVAQFLKQTHVPAPLCTQRNALLKLARHSDLVPVLKRLRPTTSSTEGGEPVNDVPPADAPAAVSQRLFGKAAAYRPLVRAGNNEYDNSPSLLRQQHIEDSVLLSRVSRNEQTHSVAVRYQLLHNEFERLCAAAVAANDASVLLVQSHGHQVRDQGNNKKRSVVSETNLQIAQALIAKLNELKNLSHNNNNKNQNKYNAHEKDADSEAVREQLFHLFLRRTDKLALAKGVLEYIMLDGLPITGEDAMAMEEEEKVEDDNDEVTNNKLPLETSHAKKLKQQSDVSTEGTSSSSSSDSSSESNDEEVPATDSSTASAAISSDEQQKVSLFSALQLRDEHGYVWHGTVLDTDMVQKTMPGKRIASHRALVVVGNMRGTAGFGSGKGKTPALAVEAAFRAALKKLSHIDLYENTGLAHDCFGQHNSCRAYVTATPPSRLAVASPFAEAVLNAFGIGSASVKLVGRRNPYSMVNAMFNALGKHENIDEYAKRRGKRYLTLKWLKEQKV